MGHQISLYLSVQDATGFAICVRLVSADIMPTSISKLSVPAYWDTFCCLKCNDFSSYVAYCDFERNCLGHGTLGTVNPSSWKAPRSKSLSRRLPFRGSYRAVGGRGVG